MSQISLDGIAKDSTVMPDGAGGDEWYTPKWILDIIGTIDVDPCWSPDSLVKANRVISKHAGGDGLNEPWIVIGNEVVFGNVPFSNTSKWLSKAEDEANTSRFGKYGRQVIVLLIPAYPGDGPWDKFVWPNVRYVGWIRGRISFLNPLGEFEQKGRGHGLVVMGPDSETCADWVYAAMQRDIDKRVQWTKPIRHTSDL